MSRKLNQIHCDETADIEDEPTLRKIVHLMLKKETDSNEDKKESQR